MYELLYNIIIFIIIVIWHEVGHYLAYRFFGLHPTIKLKWWGIEIGGNVFLRMKLKHYFSVALLGVIFGLLPIFLYAPNLIFVYILMSGIDLLIIINIMTYEGDNNNTVYQKNMEEYEEMKKDYKKYVG